MVTEIKKRMQVVFRIGEETKPIILGKENYQQSLFMTQIDTAIALIRQKAEPQIKDRRKKGMELLSRFNDVYDNNIVSFIGERGSGKSSCMYSVINVLADMDEAADFAFLDTLDPSFFDESHNILQLIIGKMYAQFTKGIAKDKGKDEDGIYKLVQLFQKAKSHLKFLDSKPNYVDDNELEELSQLSAGVELRSCLKELIDAYLMLMGRKTLVVTVDDIDLNTAQAYDMAEQVRKFLILPNVVILMAVKLDQLTDVVRLKLTEEYKDLLTRGQMSDDTIVEMADRYIKKLLPLENRVYMPTFDLYIERPLRIECEGEDPDEYKSVKMAIPALIFQKCRYLFYNTRGVTSLIVPRNLRDLRLLVSMLYRMPDYTGEVNDEINRRADENNKNVFKKYFFNDWLNTLGNTSKLIAQKLIAVSEPTQMNKSVIQELKKHYGLEHSTNTDINGWDIILQDNAVNYNLSVGDAFSVMDYVRRVNADADTQRLIFFIKSLYSIRLYEYYDQQTGDIDLYDQTKDPKEEKKPDEEPNRRDDFLENISNYMKLAGGSFFNLGGKTLLPPERKGEDEDDGNSREIFMVNQTSLIEAIAEIREASKALAGKSKSELDVLTDKLRAIEFLMLTISRHFLTKKGTPNTEQKGRTYRERMEAYYDRTLQSVQNVVFDVTTPFYTMLDVRHSYGRFDDKIFEIARNWNYTRMEGEGEAQQTYTYKSLYVEMLDAADKGMGRKKEHDLLSRAGIRNAEVTDDLLEYLKSFRYSYRPGTKGLLGILAEFYQNVASYEIATYDKTGEVDEASQEEKYYTIKYTPFGCIAKFLKDKNIPLLETVLGGKPTTEITHLPSFDYIDRDMTCDEIIAALSARIPGFDRDEYAGKLRRQYFKSEGVTYPKEKIKERLQNLSAKRAWTILLQEPAAVQEQEIDIRDAEGNVDE